MRTMVLPGLDGGTRMLSRFRDLAPSTHDVSLLELPVDLWSYESLVDHFAERVCEERPCCLVAESFSGPLAVMLAAANPQSVAFLVLVASFVASPVPVFARCLPWSILFRIPFAATAARRYLLGPACDAKLAGEFSQSIRSVSSRILANRLREIIQVNVRELLRQLQCPIIYLRPTNDAIVPAHCIDAIRQLRPDIAFHTIEGPHLILETKPAEAWERITDFPVSD